MESANKSYSRCHYHCSNRILRGYVHGKISSLAALILMWTAIPGTNARKASSTEDSLACRYSSSKMPSFSSCGMMLLLTQAPQILKTFFYTADSTLQDI
jgi:hypothetical protein